MIKIIKVTSCMTCPLVGGCKAWKALTKKERFYVTFGNGVPKEFILEKCHLEDLDND